jgi:hypothetical protein
MDLICFSTDYAAARARFLDRCARLGAPVMSFRHPMPGPSGEQLATDAAWFGPRDASRVLVLISATHGVEGFCGSGIQIDWLTDGGPATLPEGVATLVVHAINPYGFAWLRRVTHEGIDLNRNWIDFTGPLPGNPGYDELADALLPTALDGPAFAAAEARLRAFRERHGETAYRIARTAGQWRHPAGFFYGGTAPSWSRRTLEQIAADLDLAGRALIGVIDFHTGLGPYGYGEPICGHRPGTPGQSRARAWYGDALTEPLVGTSSSVPIQGLQQYGWDRMVGDRHVFIALEFGTYPVEQGDVALRDEHWLHAHGQPDWADPATQRIQRALRRFYYPDNDDWREAVLFRGRQVIRQALAGLQSS